MEPHHPFGLDLTITFVCANNLAIGDIRTSDPYIIAKIDDVLSFRTTHQVSTLSPVWNEVWKLANVRVGAKLSINVWDCDAASRDELLGKAEYVFDMTLGNFERVLNVIKPNGKPRGTITLKIEAQPSNVEGPVCFLGPVRYEQHVSTLAGAVTRSFTDDKYLAYSSYTLFLPHIRTVFGSKKQHWNTQYHNAQTIFGQGPKSTAVRSVVVTQHTGLYRPGAASKHGVITSGKDFLTILNHGKRQGVPKFYTYAIVDECMRFSETGAAFFTDFMSKHAMHACCEEEVFYAGEFHIEETPDGRHKLVIDNNSGTYAPDKNDLPKLQHLFSRNFPDLEVEAVDREDPRLVQFKKSL